MKTFVAVVNGQQMPDEIAIASKEVVARESTNFGHDEHPNLTRVLDFMHANLFEPLEIEDLVAQQNLGRRALEKQFRESTGMSVGKALNNLRLEHIAHLLETTKLPMSDFGASMLAGCDGLIVGSPCWAGSVTPGGVALSVVRVLKSLPPGAHWPACAAVVCRCIPQSSKATRPPAPAG